jgi:hypothetical protein
MLRAAEFDGSVTPSHWQRSNWLLQNCRRKGIVVALGRLRMVGSLEQDANPRLSHSSSASCQIMTGPCFSPSTPSRNVLRMQS